MNATLFSDASVCHQTGAAGWGAWCKSDLTDRGQLVGSSFKDPIPDVHVAELCGLVNAVIHFTKVQIIRPNMTIMLQCDSTMALAVIRKHVPGTLINHHINAPKHSLEVKRPLAPQEQKCVDLLKQFQQLHSLAYTVRHVKGHKPGGGRFWVNRVCDDMAKRHMREARAELKKLAAAS